MPQTLTYKIDTNVEKGPSIKSEAKIETSLCSAVLEETVCRCGSLEIELNIPDLRQIEMLVITADPYKSDKEACIPNGASMPPCKYVRYQLDPPLPAGPAMAPCKDGEKDKGICKQYPFELSRPHVMTSPLMIHLWGPDLSTPKPLTKISFYNELPLDVKVSVMAVRMTKKMCEMKCA